MKALDYLDSRINLEKLVKGRRNRMSLGPMRAICAELGNPQKRFRSVHITGTVGKGSTAYYLSKLLESKGFRVGLYVSPHVQSVRERIQVNGKLISIADFDRAVAVVAKANSSSKASYFDLLTAAAFWHFAKKRVDWAVVEVGLGGRLDSTNVIPSSLAIITNVGSDHSDVLGRSLVSKAQEKSGIIRGRSLVLSGVSQPQARRVVEKECEKRRAKRFQFGSDFFPFAVQQHSAGIEFSVQVQDRVYGPFTLPGFAQYQAENFSFAWAGFVLLAKQNRWGLSKLPNPRPLQFPGRFEIVKQKSGATWILDGAHMPEAIEATLQSLRSMLLPAPRVFLFACSADKDYGVMLKLLSQWADRGIVTTANTPRAVEGSVLAKAAGVLVIQAKDASQAFEIARERFAEATLLVTGSFYLVGEIRSLLLKEPHEIGHRRSDSYRRVSHQGKPDR